MRKFLLAAGLATAMVGPSIAHADCHGRRVAGTVIGAVAGGLIGNGLTHGGGRPIGTLLGAGAGAYAGHEIAGSGCHNYYRRAYYGRRHYYSRRAYYDRYAANNPPYGAPVDPARCETRQEPFYDERGQLVYRPTQVCR
jgi:hypothetical protein